MSASRAPFTESDYARAMLRDQFRLRSMIRRIRQAEKTGKDQSENRARWEQLFQQSIDTRQLRKAALPNPQLDATLPIAERAEEIRQAISNHQVVVISGETGSGKSTQLPLICLQMGLGINGYIGHTQPRRIAARGVAARVADQLKSQLGESVGFKIRFSDQTSPTTLVKVMTDGILLAETQTDRFLNQYEVIIVDEAHERSLNIDFLMGYIKRLLPKRPELKLIITSATIDTRRFAEHFTIQPQHAVPVVNVEGRTYPVEMHYRPPGFDRDGNQIDQDIESATVAAVHEMASRDRGDMLIFLPTEMDIRNLAKKLRLQKLPGDGNNKTEILPLYARLSTEQQNLIFNPGKARRIVLATNVAESSITVPRIRYVIDTGTARISRYAPRSKVQRLPIEAVSQASADQRAGRCGRIGPGTCLRLYSQEDFAGRPKFTTPEIRRTNLASVILQTKALSLGAIEEFPFIDAPGSESIRDGYRTLHEIGAVDRANKLTPLGRKLSRLPVDPRIGRMLFAASENGCLAEMLVIASALEIQDPRVRPAEKQAAADQQHAKFKNEQSDFIGQLQMWEFIHQLRDKLSRNQFRKACAQNFLSFSLVRQWMDIFRQLKSMARDCKLDYSSDRENYAAIHQSLLAGMLAGVAMQNERREYLGGRGVRFNIWPGSGLAQNKTSPQWILVAEIVETAKRYGRNVAKIDDTWIEPLAQHLVKRNYSEPHWSKKRQSATAYQRVTLFGLPIVARRPVRYGPIDPDLSRQLLIDEGLAEDQMRLSPQFLIHNRQVIVELETMAAKTRQRDWILDLHVVRDFYDRRLPADVVDGATLALQLKRDKALEKSLRMTQQDLMPEDQAQVSEHDFPSKLEIGNLKLPVQYNFSPGSVDDGVSIQIPVAGVAQIHESQLGWLVPGLLEPRIVALIRSLPKRIRRGLVPAPDTAKQIVDQIRFGEGSFWHVVAEELTKIGHEPVTPDMFNREKLDEHLRMNVQVCDEQGVVVAQARSLGELRDQLPDNLRSTEIEKSVDSHKWHRDGLTDWTWDELPGEIVLRRGVADVPLFPTIVDCHDHVNLRLLDHRELSEFQTRLGLATLYRLAHRKAIKAQVNWLPDLDRLSVLAMTLFAGQTPEGRNSAQQFKAELGQLISLMAFVDDQKVILTRQAFDERNKNAAERTAMATQKIAPWLSKFLSNYQQCRVKLENLSDRYAYAREDIQRQFSHLFRDSFMANTRWRWLQHYPRYLEAVLLRLDRLSSGSLARDQEQTAELEEFCCRYSQRLAARAMPVGIEQELEYFAWMIQEYRVSLFAQQLGTCETVSAKRLEKQWQKVLAS